MTTAILLTGFLRFKDQSRDDLMRLIERYDAKLFIATWDITDIDRKGRIDFMPVLASELVEFYGDCLADVSIRSHALFERTHKPIEARDRPHDLLTINPRAQEHGTVWMNRLYAQWLVVRDGLRMIAEYERRTGEAFDMICRTRTDCPVVGSLPEWPQDRLLVSAKLPHDMNYDRGWVPDFFLFGPRAEMMKLGDIAEAIQPMYDRQNIDTTNAENLLIHYLVRHDIPVAVRDVPLRRIMD